MRLLVEVGAKERRCARHRWMHCGRFVERLRYHLRYLSTGLVGVVLLSAPFASTQAQSGAAAQLVEAMRIDEMTLLGLRIGLQRSVQEGSKALDCVKKKLDRTIFAPVYVQVVAVNLTAQEMASSAAFFESAPGRKYIDSGIFQLYQATGIAAADPEAILSDIDLQAIIAFSRTSAGEKLLVERILDTPETRAAIGARIEQLLMSCSQ